MATSFNWFNIWYSLWCCTLNSIHFHVHWSQLSSGTALARKVLRFLNKDGLAPLMLFLHFVLHYRFGCWYLFALLNIQTSLFELKAAYLIKWTIIKQRIWANIAPPMALKLSPRYNSQNYSNSLRMESILLFQKHI